MGFEDTPLPCPACGGPTEARKCKEICARCGAIVQNCSGD
jgi:hypothetical protein